MAGTLIPRSNRINWFKGPVVVGPSSEVTNTTSLIKFDEWVVIPERSFAESIHLAGGRFIRFWVYIPVIQTTGTPTLRILVSIEGNSIIDRTQSVTAPDTFTIEGYITKLVDGSCRAWAYMHVAAGGTTPSSQANTYRGDTGSFGMSETAPLDLEVFAQWNAASSSNRTRLDQLVVMYD